MQIIGLTGGICSGKTYVSDFFKGYGITIIDADEVARELLSSHYKGKILSNTDETTPDFYQYSALQQIVDTFGHSIINSSGYLDRQKLREIVFSNPKAHKATLDAIMHPLVYLKINDDIQQLKQKKQDDTIIVSIPLLVETSNVYEFDQIWVVDCKEELQIERCLLRDKSSQSIIKNMIKSQASREARLKVADIIIDNNHKVKQLDKQLHTLLHSITQAAS